MEAGWVVTEVGRQPWIVYHQMKVEDAATANTGVWITFIAVTLLYLALGVTAILVLRGMSHAVPAGRRVRRDRGPVRAARVERAAAGGGGPMSDLVAVVLLLALTAYAVFGRRRLRRRVLGPDRRRPRARRPTSRPDRALDRAGLGGQPRLADLRVRGHLDGVLGGLRLDHADPLRPAHARRARHRAARGQLRLPQVRGHPAQPAAVRRRLRRVVRPGARSSWVPSPAGSPRAGCPPAARQATRSTAGSTRPRSSRVSSPWWRSPTWRPSTWSGRPAATSDAELTEYFRRRAVVSAVVVAVVAAIGMVVLHADAPYVFDGMTGTGAARSSSSASSAASAPWCCWPATLPRGARVLAVLAVAGIVVAWGVAQWPYLLPESLTVSDAAAPTGTLQALVVTVVLAVAHRRPGVRAALRPRPAAACSRRRACPTPPTGRRCTTEPSQFIPVG